MYVIFSVKIFWHLGNNNKIKIIIINYLNSIGQETNYPETLSAACVGQQEASV